MSSKKCVNEMSSGVCYHYDKSLYCGKTVSNSDYGWDDTGSCVVEVTDGSAAQECCLYEPLE